MLVRLLNSCDNFSRPPFQFFVLFVAYICQCSGAIPCSLLLSQSLLAVYREPQECQGLNWELLYAKYILQPIERPPSPSLFQLLIIFISFRCIFKLISIWKMLYYVVYNINWIWTILCVFLQSHYKPTCVAITSGLCSSMSLSY